MQIYIGNLSQDTTNNDLAALFEGSEETPSLTIKSYQKGDVTFYYAVASVEPDSLAKEIIATHNLQKIKDRMIELHVYKDRTVFNERRAFGWGSKKWLFEERRKIDRRLFRSEQNSHESVDPVDPKVIHVQF